MKLGNFFKKSVAENPANAPAENPAANQWQKMAEESRNNQPRGAETYYYEVEDHDNLRSDANRERHGRKIIGYFMGDGTRALAQPDIIPRDGVRDNFYDELNAGRISTAEKNAMLMHIATPLDDHKTIGEAFYSLNSKHEKRIMGKFSSAGFRNFETVNQNNLLEFIERYPTPIDFEHDEQFFMDDIREHNDADKFAQYQVAMEKFKSKAYGKRYEYYKALKALEKDAAAKAGEKAARNQVLDAYKSPDERTEVLPSSSETQIDETTSELRELSRAESAELLRAGRLDGDLFRQGDRSYQLTKEHLAEFDLEPKYSFAHKNAEINLSKPYQVGDRTAIMAYVKTETGTKICSYYRSGSQGSWRLLPDYISKPENLSDPVCYYGKGYNEESLKLPDATQTKLEEISAKSDFAQPSSIDAIFAFVGTAKRYDSKGDYLDSRDRYHNMRGDFYREVDQRPSFYFGEVSREKADPDSLGLGGPTAPDFAHKVGGYEANSPMYGKYSVETFSSANGELTWSFGQIPTGQAWVTGTEVAGAKLSSDGLPTKWASIGDYGTPLYEYARQADGYGTPSPFPSRVGMWANYLSKMPLIKQYLWQKSH